MAKRGVSIAVISGLAVIGLILRLAGPAVGDPGTPPQLQAPASDREAGYLVFPKIVVDDSGTLHSKHSVDTIIQLTNTDSLKPHVVHCFYINATSHCSVTGDACLVKSDCNVTTTGVDFQTCDPNPTCGAERNFDISLSPNQAIGWSASNGGAADPASPPTNPTVHGFGGTILGVSEPVFFGELKCVEVDGTCLNISQCGAAGATTFTPINSNDLKGEATIFSVDNGTTASVDARSYNAIGFPTVNTDGLKQNDQVMCLGSTAGSSECAPGHAEYASCPGALILDHWFDGAVNDFTQRPVTTELTLVPCTEDVSSLDPALSKNVVTTVQLLVFNEFEQRFSGTTRLNCFKEILLSDLDVKVGQEQFSIFNFSLEGTLTGQTRIRPVAGNETDRGHGILGIAEEFNNLASGAAPGPELSAAINVNYVGSQGTQGDFVRFSP